VASAFPLIVLFWGAVGYAPCRIFNLNVLLDLKEDVSHVCGFMLHQILVKGVDDLQPSDESCCRNVFIAVIYLSHLSLKITDVVLEILLGLHLDGEVVIVVLLEFMLGSELIIEGLPHLLEVSKQVAQKRVEPVGGDPLEAEGDNVAHEVVIMRLDCHLILKMSKILERIGRSGVEVEARHHKLPQKMMGHDFL